MLRRITRFALPTLLTTLSFLPAHAQTETRVQPACLPIPLPGVRPLPPKMARTENPWVLPMNGRWRFQLTHGQIVNGRFGLSEAQKLGLTASSTQGGHPAQDAFDGKPETRWCASGSSFPQSIQMRLNQTRHVSGVRITWERPNETYRCRLEGSDDGAHWRTLADASVASGIGDGLLSAAKGGAPVRYVRIVVLGSSNGGWVSIRECELHYDAAGRDTVYHPGAQATAQAVSDAFTRIGFDDSHWDSIPVPSNWEMLGYSLPTYNAVDDTVGLYRRWMTVPASWAGRRIIWRFDGALDGTELWVNGQRAGYHESGYTAFDVDLTGLLKPGQRNLFTLRISKTTPSSDCETGDYQSLGGVYRETSLIAVPQTHAQDLTVRTPLAANYRDATLETDLALTGTAGQTLDIRGSIIDAATGRALPETVRGQATIGRNATASLSIHTPIAAPKLWSAEKPNLYYLVLNLSQRGKVIETVQQRFGFRQVGFKDHVLLWNGRPIKCEGICRHDFWADKGFALTDTEWQQDIALIKATNINAVRTSHYNHAARFLELCDEVGLYILDEVPFCWVGDKVKDPKFAPPLLKRTAETIARDKNRPCVLAWSLGNENPTGTCTQQVWDLAHALDPTRPAFCSGASPATVIGQPFRDTHYPGPSSIDNYIAKDTGKYTLDITEHPHTFYTKGAQDYDPGVSDVWTEGLIDTWDKLWRTPTILGSFIWEWQNQGIADRNPDRETDFWFGPDHLRQENNKGIVDAYCQPKAEWWIVKSVYSPVAVLSRTVKPNKGLCTVTVGNHYAFTDLAELPCRWTARNGGKVIGSGVASVACAPDSLAEMHLPTPEGMTSLHLAFHRSDGSEVMSALLPVRGAPRQTAPAAQKGSGPLTVQKEADSVRLSNKLQAIVFDGKTGEIRTWQVQGHTLLTDTSSFNFGEAKKARDDGKYYHTPPGPLTHSDISWAENGPDGSVTVSVVTKVQREPDGAALETLTRQYDIRPTGEIAVHWDLAWNAPETHLWEIGLKLPVNPAFTKMEWRRDSYLPDYPTGHIGEPTGICRTGDVSFRSSKRGLHWMTLTDKEGNGIALIENGSPLIGRAVPTGAGITLYASEEVAAAGPEDLSRSWFAKHDITAKAGAPLSGDFLLRAIAP